MGIKMLEENKTLTALIDGDIDHHTAAGIREAIDAFAEKSPSRLLKMDFGGVQFMDSSGIGLIMGRYKYMKAQSGELRVVNVPKRLERMIKLSGLEKLGIFESSENSKRRQF